VPLGFYTDCSWSDLGAVLAIESRGLRCGGRLSPIKDRIFYVVHWDHLCEPRVLFKRNAWATRLGAHCHVGVGNKAPYDPKKVRCFYGGLLARELIERALRF